MDKNNYRIYFVDGTTALITEEEYNLTIKGLEMSRSERFMITNRGLVFNIEQMTHIELERSLDQVSSYIAPKEPNEIKEQKEKQRVARISDLAAVIDSHKELSADEMS